MQDPVTTQQAAELVNQVHEWVIALAGARFDPAAVVEADSAAVAHLESGASFTDALERGKNVYMSSLTGQPLRVAVVDDESDVRVLLRLHLDPDRFQVVGEAATGEDAIKVVEEQRPDAVILDLNMPVLDGVEALRVIKERWPGVSVIIHTAFGEIFRSKLDGLDFEGFVEKNGTFEAVSEQLHALFTP